MAGEVGPTALALAKVLMVMATSMVGLLGVDGGLSPPDSSRDGTDFHHFPATTDEKDCVSWVNASGGAIPADAWVAWAGDGGGRGQEQGEAGNVYVGRAGHEGGLYPGTLLPHRCMVMVTDKGVVFPA